MIISEVKHPGHQPQYLIESNFEATQSTAHSSKDWSYLIPTISTLALGIILLENIPIGIAIGVGDAALTILTAITANALNLLTNENSEHRKEVRNDLLGATLMGPFIEEILFRGAIQPLATRVIAFLIPAAATAFLGTSLSIATTVSIVATAALFGLVHISNNHKNSHLQAISATMSGIFLGITAAQFGLPAAIAAHIVHNTILMTLAINQESAARTSQAQPSI